MRYRVNDAKVAWRIADGEAVLLHADTSAYFGLNGTGTILWAGLASGSMAADDLTAWAARRFSPPPPDLSRDVTAFLEQLREHDLVEIVPEANAGAGPDPVLPEDIAVPEYEAPELLPYGELEKLILSGE